MEGAPPVATSAAASAAIVLDDLDDSIFVQRSLVQVTNPKLYPIYLGPESLSP